MMLIFHLFLSFSFAWAVEQNVALEYKEVGGVGMNVVWANPQAEGVKIGLIRAIGCDYDGNVYCSQSFHSMMMNSGARAGVVGTYFGLANCEPVGAVALNGSLIYDGLCHSVFQYRKDRNVILQHYARNTRGHDVEWDGVLFGLGGSPSLVISGVPDVEPERFHHGIGGFEPRAAIGVTKSKKVVLVVTQRASLWGLAKSLASIGVVDAMNLDGGTSTAMWYDNKAIVSPGRQLTNIIGIWEASATSHAHPLDHSTQKE